MSKLDKKPLQQAQLSKSSHDLSHTYDFTSSTGMILPLEHDILNPGESIECKIDLSNTRTMPLQAAAYLDLDLHVDYFFVPFTLLYGKFESFIYRIDDYYSSAKGLDISTLPLGDLSVWRQFCRENAYERPSTIGALINFDDFGKGSLRLLDHLGLGDLNSINYSPKVFLYQLLAYNAIYEYYFRNDEYEKFDNTIFNLDQLAYSNEDLSPDAGSYGMSVIGLKYRDKYHDYFTSIKASPIVSGNNLRDSAGSLSLAKSWLSRSESYNLANGSINAIIDGGIGSSGLPDVPDRPNSSSTRTEFGFNTGTTVYANNPSAGFVSPNGTEINTANLRALFANEKLWTVTGMNRKQYDAQTLAHYGYNVPTDVMHQCQHIGHHLYQVKVGEVISTSGTSTQPLATVAGKGYAFENKEKPIRFTAPCHGVFMAVYSSAIHRNYFNNFRKENAVATWQDFYQPEFDHLGMQPIFGFEGKSNSYDSTTPDWTNLIGWQYRYEQYKRRYDRSTTAFATRFKGNTGSSGAIIGPFSSWGPSTEAYEASNMVNMEFMPIAAMKWLLKESPCELNGVMAVQYDPRWYEGAEGEELDYLTQPWQSYATDPLVHHAYIDYKKLSTMSAYSMPRLDA